MATVPQIISVYPPNNGKGVVLSDTIRVIFDQEMDTSTINTGTFVLGGPDNSSVFSPLDVTPFDLPGFDDENIESFPYFSSSVSGEITFKKVDQYGNELSSSLVDYEGDGTLWRTMAIFTPSQPLQVNTDYFVMLAGDETPSDDFDSGIRTRTVFDTQKTAGTGSAVLNFYGGYTGDNNREYVVRFTSNGAIGSAEYEWWNKNDPLTVYDGLSSTGERELEDGIYVTCDPDGTFEIGDIFEVLVVPAIVLENNYKWEFSTGNGNIIIPPSTSSTTGIESITTSDGISTSGFYVASVDPSNSTYGVEISEDLYVGEAITITFSDVPIQTAEELGDLIVIKSETTVADPALTATGILDWTGTLTDNVLTINLDPGQLYTNNIITVEINKSISDSDSNYLSEDYLFYFTTEYTPLYTNKHRIYLDLGSLAVDIPESTIMGAILEASLMVDALSFVTNITNIKYYNLAKREFTACMAELILLRGLSGNMALSSKMSKTLGDLKVSRDGGSLDIADKIRDKEDCMANWKIVIESGGAITPNASLSPIYAVKGSQAIDAITVGRQWEPTHGFGVSSYSAANTKKYRSGRRSLRSYKHR